MQVGIVGEIYWDEDDLEFLTTTIYNSYSTTDLIGHLSECITDSTVLLNNSQGNITKDSLKTYEMIEKLNKDITTEKKFKQDTNSKNNGYPILE